MAIKTLNPSASEGDRIKFLQEAAIMGQFFHPNVVKLHGVVTVGEPVSVPVCVSVCIEHTHLHIIVYTKVYKAAKPQI